MTYTTLVIKHSEISDVVLNNIFQLKAVRWNYSIEQHNEWIKNNIQKDDLHLLIMDENKIVGYTNLIKIKVNINNCVKNFYGIGNVCTIQSGTGLGNILMAEVNKVIIGNKNKGLLLCKDHLIEYYKKFSWKAIEKEKIEADHFFGINFMTFNFNEDIISLKYNDRNF